MEMAQRIRQSLNLADILQATVEEVRQFLQVDRVLLFRLGSDGVGTVVVESVLEPWTSILATQINDPCLGKICMPSFQAGQITAKSDIYREKIDPCHVALLASFQVRANLVVPIFQGAELWGLLISHHCQAPRNWQTLEIELLQQLALQVSIAMQQASLYEQVQAELKERQQVELALRDNTAELEELYNNAPCGYHSIDRNGTFVRINDTELSMLGYRRDEVIGKLKIDDLLTEDSLELFQRIFPRFKEQGRICDLEFEMIRKDGSIFPVSISATAVYDTDGNYKMSRSVVVDISERSRIEHERKQVELELQQAQQWILTTWESMTDAYVLLDHDWRISYANTAANQVICGMTGLLPQDILGQVHWDLFPWTVGQPIDHAYHRAMEDRIPVHMELFYEPANSWFEVHAYPSDIGLSLYFRDITQKKQLELQFLRVQRLESVGTLASGIAHDLNNIFTPILAAAQLLPLKFPNADTSTQQLLQMLNDSAHRGADLVQQILSFGRGTEGRKMPLQAGHLLLEISRVAEQTFPKSIEIRSSISTRDLWTIVADATEIYQVMMNLCINARDAMPSGGIMTLTAENQTIDQSYAKTNVEAKLGPYIVLTVSDTGTGIPLDVLDRIFDPFFTTKELGKGTGLGLSTVMGIVKNHEGWVTVYSAPGQGTVFRVYLPAAAA
jgi:PAS domain S-box-containing protein